MKTLVLKLLSFTEERKTVELSEKEIEGLTDVAELSSRLETLQTLQDRKHYSLEKEIEDTTKELIKSLREAGMLESGIVDKVFHNIYVPYIRTDEDYIMQLLSEME